MNPTRQVIIALSLAAIIFIVAGDKWQPGLASIKSVKPAARGKTA